MSHVLPSHKRDFGGCYERYSAQCDHVRSWSLQRSAAAVLMVQKQDLYPSRRSRRAGDVPGFADTSIFNMARDDQLTFGEKELSRWPKLQAMYEACDAVPEIRKWIADWEARDV